jgi:hypothetical protein
VGLGTGGEVAGGGSSSTAGHDIDIGVVGDAPPPGADEDEEEDTDRAMLGASGDDGLTAEEAGD